MQMRSASYMTPVESTRFPINASFDLPTSADFYSIYFSTRFHLHFSGEVTPLAVHTCTKRTVGPLTVLRNLFRKFLNHANYHFCPLVEREENGRPTGRSHTFHLDSIDRLVHTRRDWPALIVQIQNCLSPVRVIDSVPAQRLAG